MYDAVVIGAGPAGLHASRRLADAGARVAVVEEHPVVGHPVHCTGVLAREALDEFDLPRTLVLNELTTARFYSPSGQRIVNEDRAAALAESKAFLDAYYTAKFSPQFVEQWTVAGGPKACAAQLRAYFEAGLGHMALRLASWDQRGQLARFLGEVAPALGDR
jgi:phytoene dehydrogenase-like protein